MTRLETLGWTSHWIDVLADVDPAGRYIPARVIEERKKRVRVIARSGELRAEVCGRLQYAAADAQDLPCVGDWVGVSEPEGDGPALVRCVLPRRSALVRKAPDRAARAQLLAANVDVVFILEAVEPAPNPRRVERMVALAREGGAQPVVLLSKVDRVDGDDPALESGRGLAAGTDVLSISNLTGAGLSQLQHYLKPGHTVALLGASGAGKSSLANRLLGTEHFATGAVRERDGKGRHSSTHRELASLPGGALLIDTPGLREIGLWEDEGGVDAAFPELAELSSRCRYSDCSHGDEPGCAVRAALESGELDADRLAHYDSLKREAEYLRTRRDRGAWRAQRARWRRAAGGRSRERWRSGGEGR